MKKLYCRIIDTTGKLLLAWMLFSTIRYFYTGRFIEQLNWIPKMIRAGDTLWLIYDLFQIPVAAIGIFLLIPLLFKGHVGGLVFGFIYWVMGCPTNPLWFIVPHELQVGPDGKATNILEIINYSYGILSLAILVAFYFYRRSLRINAHNDSLQPTEPLRYED
jgi:hypothetical protein